jgi:thioredoxin-related protein
MKRSVTLLLVLIFFCALKAQKVETMEQAKLLAQKEEKKILLIFQGSDWCAPCMKLEREILNTDRFEDYARENLLVLKVDFPRRKKNALSPQQQNRNNNLAERFNPNGHFPLLVLLNEKEEELGRIGYVRSTPGKFIEMLESLK